MPAWRALGCQSGQERGYRSDRTRDTGVGRIADAGAAGREIQEWQDKGYRSSRSRDAGSGRIRDTGEAGAGMPVPTVCVLRTALDVSGEGRGSPGRLRRRC